MPNPLVHAAVVSTISAVWTLIASITAVAIGMSADSLALVAFGAIGLFDCASDVVLIVHFRRGLDGANSDHLEQLAIQLVGIGLVVIAIRTVYSSATALADRRCVQLTIFGALLGLVTVAGIAATQLAGWWWAGPSAALVIAVGALLLGGQTLLQSRDVTDP